MNEPNKPTTVPSVDDIVHTRRYCDVCQADVKFLERFNDQVAMLTGMVQEIIEGEPQMILSPVMRRLLVDKAKEVESLHAPLRRRLCVDNPGNPLEPYTKVV